MPRSWEENRKAINQLWKHCEWEEEERAVWADRLSHLDQDLVYRSLRHVYATRDSAYPKLAWVLEAYKTFKAEHDESLRPKNIANGGSQYLEQKRAARASYPHDEEASRSLREKFAKRIDESRPEDHEAICEEIISSLDVLLSRHAYWLLGYASDRLLGTRSTAGSIDRDGESQPLAIQG